jgi:hypothetical protein
LRRLILTREAVYLTSYVRRRKQLPYAFPAFWVRVRTPVMILKVNSTTNVTLSLLTGIEAVVSNLDPKTDYLIGSSRGFSYVLPDKCRDS